MKLGALAHLLLALMGASASADGAPITIHRDWEKSFPVYQYGRYFVAAAPDETTIRKFKEEKGGWVVDLRGLKELDCSSRTTATQAGMKYESIPLESNAGLRSEAVARVESILGEASDRPVMLVCEHGNRSAAILAIHLAETEHLAPAEAIRRAEELGMTSPKTKSELKRYLSRR